jgi:hypothetical protein
MFGKAFAIWFLLLMLAVLNGSAREFLINPWIGQQPGHIVSTIILCLVIFIVVGLTISWIGPRTSHDALRIGLLWLILTIAFEFLAGHYLFGNPWQTLVADYDVFDGRIWFLVLLANFLSPVIAFRFRRLAG